MKKILATLLCLAVAASIAGCSSSSASSSSGSSSGTSSNASAGAAESGKLVVWAWDQNLESINKAFELFKKENADAKVEIDIQNVSDTVSKLSTFFASGAGTDLPDVVLMDNMQIQGFLQQFPDKFVNLSQIGYDQYKDKFSKAQWELLSTGGSIYAFPFDIAPIMVQANTKIFDQVGVNTDSLKTWDDVMGATKKVTDAGYAMNVKFDKREVFALLQSAGVGIFDAKGNIDLLNPKVVEAVELFKKLRETNTADGTAESAAFGEGKVAMYMKPAWSVGEDMAVQTALSGISKLIPLPKIKDAAGYTSAANDGGSSFFILSSSKLKNTAYKVCEKLTTDLDSQEIGLKNGLMPGLLAAKDLPSVTKGVDYYNGQAIWKLLSDSAADTAPVYVNQYYSTSQDAFKNIIIDAINAGTDKSAKDLLQEAADTIATQTGLTVNKY